MKTRYFIAIAMLGIGMCMMADDSTTSIESLQQQRDSLQKIDSRLKDELDSLKGVKNNYKKIRKSLNDTIDIRNKKILNLQDSINKNSKEIKKQITQAEDSLKNLEGKIQIAEIYLDGYITKLAKEYSNYAQNLYSQISIDTLKIYIDEAKKHTDNTDMVNAMRELERAMDLKEMVVEYFNYLKQPYDGPKIEKARDNIFYHEKKFSKAQWQEVYDTLDAYLSRYKGGLSALSSVIKQIDKICNDGNLLHSDKKEKIEKLFNSEENKKNEERYYSKIPFLGERYNKLREIFKGTNPDEVVKSDKYITIRNEIIPTKEK